MPSDDTTADGATPIHEFLTPEEHLGADAAVRSMGWLLAIDDERTGCPLPAYPLVLCPATQGESFTVFRCTRAITIPDGARLAPAADVLTVVDGDYQYNLLQCRLVSPAEAATSSADLLTAPPELQGRTIRETAATSPPFWDALVAKQERAATDDASAADGDSNG